MRIVVDRLTQVRGGRILFQDLAFSVARGEALVLTGPNGAGKTTLIRTLAGLLAPVAGTVTLVDGDPEASLPEHAHYVGHTNALKASLTVAENAAFWCAYLGAADDATPVLARLGLETLADIPSGDLSAGQKRRLGLARLLLAPRPIWLLDEPTVSLDADSQKLVADLIDSHCADGGLAVVATHLPLGLSNATALILGAEAAA
jgi:heme exporter protein A